MKLKTSKVDLSQKLKAIMSISAIYGISHAECVQMVSAANAKLTAVLQHAFTVQMCIEHPVKEELNDTVTSPSKNKIGGA